MDTGLAILIGIPIAAAIWGLVVVLRRERVNRRMAAKEALEPMDELHDEQSGALAAYQSAQLIRGIGVL